MHKTGDAPAAASLQAKLLQGVALYERGKLADAERSLGELLQQQPDNFNALHLLGIIACQTLRTELGVTLIRKAIGLNAKVADAHSNLGNALLELNLPEKALTSFDEALVLKSDLASAWLGRGNVLSALKRNDEALAAYDKALALRPDLALAWLGRGNVFNELKRHDDAFSAYDKALALQPDLAMAWLGRGNVFYSLKRYDDAIPAYDKALALRPDLALAWLGRGNIFNELKRYDDAVPAYDKALALQPDLALAWLGRGNVFGELRRHDEAFAAYDKALALRPDLANAWLGRGHVFYDVKRYDEAVAAYDKALALQPDLAMAWLGRGNVFYDIKRYDEAVSAYDKALALQPDFANAWLGRSLAHKESGRFEEALSSFDKQLKLTTPKEHNRSDDIVAIGKAIFSLDCIPAVYVAESEIKEVRAGLQKTLEGINSGLSNASDGKALAFPQSVLSAVFRTTGFYIAYQQENDRDLMRSYSQVLRKLLLVDDRPPASNAKGSHKIRFGIASELLKNHPGTRYAYEWLSHLPKDDYEFFIYAFHRVVDEVTEKFAKLGTFKRLPFDQSAFEDSIDLMKADNLHFLMLPDVGMTTSSRILSQYRIAPVQFTSWGHPVTTGSPNIDYFLSSDLMEIPSADEHYTEKLIRLPNASRFIEPGSILFDESISFDLPQDRILYGCLQSTYKLLPQFDMIFPKIAKRVPSAYFVFVEGNAGYMTTILKRRLTLAFEREGLNADKYIRFLPRMTERQYASLFKALHINIDSIGWSGGYTTVECIEADCPIVTLPTPYMRGRHSYAILKMMGLDELIATSLDDFIDKLSHLGSNPDWRLAIANKISQDKHRLYRDWTLIEAFDAFLKNEFSKLPS